MWLNCTDNKAITTVAPFGRSLRHLVTNVGLSDAGLTTATDLVTLDCGCNPNITSIGFCRSSLQELTAVGADCGIKGDEIAEAPPQLRKVVTYHNDKITLTHLKGFADVGLFHVCSLIGQIQKECCRRLHHINSLTFDNWG